MNVVNRTKTAEWPSGQAWEIRKSLDESITPKDLPARVKMLSELSQVELKPEEHPKILFDKISAIQCKYAQEYSTADAIATILRAAPREYARVIASVHINKGSNMTENDLKTAMSLTYRSDIKGMNSGYVDGQSGWQKELQLSNVGGKKETRRCHKCHEQGHLAADCKVVIKCEICGGRHRAIACFEDPRNAHRRPNNWESKLSEAEKKKHFGSEKAIANIDGIYIGGKDDSGEDKHVHWKEVYLANIDKGEVDKEAMKEPSIWIDEEEVTSKTGSDDSSVSDDGKALMIANIDVDPKEEWEDSAIIAAGEEWKLKEKCNESIQEYE
jgi:hypothetical protein